MENNQKFEQIIKIIGLIILALVITSVVVRLLPAIFRLIVFVVVLVGLYYGYTKYYKKENVKKEKEED